MEQILEEINARLQEAEADNLTDELLEESVAGIQRCLEMDPQFIEARFGVHFLWFETHLQALVYVYGHLNKYDEALQELETIKEAGGDDERWRVMKQELENMMYDMEEEEEQHERMTQPNLILLTFFSAKGRRPAWRRWC